RERLESGYIASNHTADLEMSTSSPPNPALQWTALARRCACFRSGATCESELLGGTMGWELAAIVAAGLFAGGSVYIKLVENPARVQGGTELAVTEFGPSYHRATVMQVSLAVIGLIAGLGAWISGSGVWWLIGGVTLGAVMPFTLLVIFPTNKKL